jgi:TolB-like protein
MKTGIHASDTSKQTAQFWLASGTSRPPPLDSVYDVMTAPIEGAEIEASLGRLLASALFIKAHRMRRLLQFLVKRSMAGPAQSFKEVIIGIEVFDRDPARYDPAEDPIVRVQVGRLRTRLQTYYALEGEHADVVFSIPLGSYAPTIERARSHARSARTRYTIAIGAVQSITTDPSARYFSLGLSEELFDRMYQRFGSSVVQHGRFPHSNPRTDGAHAPPCSHLHYRIEGSVRFDSDMMRASFRLLDLRNGSITWSRQFDCHAAVTVLLQEQLAVAVCGELEAYFSRRELHAV